MNFKNIIPPEIRNCCPVCDAANFRWNPLPNQHLNLLKQHGFKHIGSCEMTPLFTYFCPVCGASDRERLYALFLRGIKAEQKIAPERMIHFAPESALSRHIRKEQYFTSYQTADMSMNGVDFLVDLQSLPFENDSFDFFICSHVLEHVPDDRKAIRELYRVLRSGGFGLLMAPVCLGIETTLEDPSIIDAGERWRLFGQDDHLRLYSHNDYVDRIRESGFSLYEMTRDDFGENVFHQLGLNLTSVLYVVGKPSALPIEKEFFTRLATAANSSITSTTDNQSRKQEKTMPKVSVILTSYNHEKYLDESIQSALSQTYRDFELIILDDASTDDSWSIIKQYNDNRIRAFRSDAQNLIGINVNKTISKIAKGEYIAIHHSDDVWELDKLEKQVDFLDQHPEIGAVFSWVIIIDENGNLNNNVFFHNLFRQNNKTRYEWLRHFYLSGNALCHPSILIRKQCYTDCGLYNPANWQLPDFDMWIRLCLKYEIHVLPEYLVKFRWKSDGSNTSAPNIQTFNRDRFEYYMLLNHYRSITDVEEFLKIFPSSKKYCSHPDANLEYALAMTAMEVNSSPIHRLFGLRLLYKLIASPERAEKIRAVHQFDNRDFGNLSKQTQIFAVPQPQPSTISNTLGSSLDQGIRAFNHEDNETAIQCLLSAMKEEPNNPVPCAYLAFVCARKGLLKETRDLISQSTKIAPERADLVAALGEVFLKNGKPSEAAEYLLKAVQTQPDLFSAYPALAQSLHLTGQSAEAVSLLETASGLSSGAQSQIQSTMLQILVECGDLSEFTKCLLRFSRGLHDDLLAARCLARFEENGERLIETLSRLQIRMAENIRGFANLERKPASCRTGEVTRIGFMVGDFSLPHQLEQLYALLRYLPAERFSTILISCYTRPPKEDVFQRCSLLADTVLDIHQDEDSSAVEKLRGLALDILVNMEVCSPSERLAVFLAAPALHKFQWGEVPIPSITPDVRILAGARLAVENMSPALVLPEMGEVFDLPELPFTDDAERKREIGKPPVIGCLVPAAGIGRNGLQLFADMVHRHPDATFVINLEDLGPAAQTFITTQFSNRGVDPARLIFISVRTIREFCLAWQSIDLGVLPPVNPGGLALPTCLWMGKPCLISGSTLPWAQRPSVMLKALGREEWIAGDTTHYVDIARQLIPPSQRRLPDPVLRERMKALGLTDPKGFARGFAEAMTGHQQIKKRNSKENEISFEEFLNEVNSPVICCNQIGHSLNFAHDALTHCCIASNASGAPKICDFNGGSFPYLNYISSFKKFTLQNILQKGTCVGCVHLHHGKPSTQFKFFQYIAFNHFSKCNLNCVYCTAEWRKKKIDPYDVIPALNDLYNNKFINEQTLSGWGGGEPTIYEYFDETFNFLLKRSIIQNIDTSAFKYSETIANAFKRRTIPVTIRVSPDSGTRETYKIIKGVDCFNTVWENITRYSKRGSNIKLKYIITDQNSDDEDLYGFIENCCDAGIVEIFISAEINTYLKKDKNNEEIIKKEACVNAAKKMYEKASSKNIKTNFLFWDNDDTNIITGKTSTEKTINKYWSAVYANKKSIKSAWWESDFAKRYINSLVTDTDSPIISDGLNRLLIKRLNGRHLKTGVSIGGGLGRKEMRLIELGVVDKFIIFELSEEAIKSGNAFAKTLNIDNKLEYINKDVFKYNFHNIEVDLIHWNNSLHHMFDVPEAVRWSQNLLAHNGVFYMDDYVGSNRFQWPDHIVKIVNEIRDSIPEKYFKHPTENRCVRSHVLRPNPNNIGDPSEAFDSEKILKSVIKYFPNAEIKLTGGIVYFIAMDGLWGNFDENNEEDLLVLEKLMEIDKLYSQMTEIMSPYATALAFKC